MTLFVICCFTCGHESEKPIRNVSHATKLGWSRVQADPDDDDGAWWTHIGECPECQAEGKQPLLDFVAPAGGDK